MLWLAIPPTPDRAPDPHFLEKRVSGSKNPHFPSAWKREFSVKKKSPFSLCSLVEKREFLTENSLFQAERGNGGFWAPEPSFPGNGDSGPVWGRGNPKLCIAAGAYSNGHHVLGKPLSEYDEPAAPELPTRRLSEPSMLRHAEVVDR